MMIIIIVRVIVCGHTQTCPQWLIRLASRLFVSLPMQVNPWLDDHSSIINCKVDAILLQRPYNYKKIRLIAIEHVLFK